MEIQCASRREEAEGEGTAFAAAEGSLLCGVVAELLSTCRTCYQTLYSDNGLRNMTRLKMQRTLKKRRILWQVGGYQRCRMTDRYITIRDVDDGRTC